MAGSEDSQDRTSGSGAFQCGETRRSWVQIPPVPPPYGHFCTVTQLPPFFGSERRGPARNPPHPGTRVYGPPHEPIQKARFTVRYGDKGTIQTRRVLHRFYDKKGLQRFQKPEQSGRLPIPVKVESVDYGLEP